MNGMSESARYYLHRYAQAHVHGYFSLNDWYSTPSSDKLVAWHDVERELERIGKQYTTPLCVLGAYGFDFTCAYCIELPDSAVLVVRNKHYRTEHTIPKDFIADLRNGASLDKLREYWQ